MLEAVALIHATQRTAEVALSARPVRPPLPSGPSETRRRA
jgi:hypothetical protein